MTLESYYKNDILNIGKLYIYEINYYILRGVIKIIISNENSGVINVINGTNPRSLYEHQVEAQRELNKINKKDEFSTLLVLPTGAGKTLTTVNWILKNAIDKDKKVLWIAHRHFLLEIGRAHV